MTNNENAQNKHELDIYQFEGNLPITNVRDCVDCLNYLIGYLVRANVITNTKTFFEEFQNSMERIGTPSGKITTIGYNMKEVL